MNSGDPAVKANAGPTARQMPGTTARRPSPGDRARAKSQQKRVPTEEEGSDADDSPIYPVRSSC